MQQDNSQPYQIMVDETTQEEEELEETFADKVNALREVSPQHMYYLGYAKTEQVVTLKEDTKEVILASMDSTLGSLQQWIFTMDGQILSARDPSLQLQVKSSKVMIAKQSKKNQENTSFQWQIVFIEPDVPTRHKYICLANNRRLVLDKSVKSDSLTIRMNNDSNDEAQKWVVFTEIPSSLKIPETTTIIHADKFATDVSDEIEPDQLFHSSNTITQNNSNSSLSEHPIIAVDESEEQQLWEDLASAQKKMDTPLEQPASQQTRIIQTLKTYISFQSLITLFLAVAMLATGTCNTLLTKAQDLQVVKGFGDKPALPYEHAFFQTGTMFLGELICLGAFYFAVTFEFFSSKLFAKYKKGKTFNDSQPFPEPTNSVNTDEETEINAQQQQPKYNSNESTSSNEYNEQDSLLKKETQVIKEEKVNNNSRPNILIYWIPSLCDLGSTTLLNVGLVYTYASVFQMLRGSLVIFNGVLSIIFLKQRLYPHHWGGIGLIFLGLLLVGLSASLFGGSTASARNPFLGNILVIVSQIISAAQSVIEEKIVSAYPTVNPLELVGWEGFFGLSSVTIVLFVLYWIPGSDYYSLENVPYAFGQIFNSVPLILLVCGSCLAIAFFNFFGISITKRISSVTRSTIDSMRTFFVWLASLLFGWEHFQWLQLLGFVVLVSGTFLHTEVIRIPYYHTWYLKNKQAWMNRKKEAALKKSNKQTPQ